MEEDIISSSLYIMAKLFEVITKYEYNPFENPNRSEAERIMRTLAKRANARLLSLERTTSEITGEKFSEYGAYQVLARPALRGRKRFKESGYKELSYKELGKRIIELQEFLSAKTSTVSGQRAAENARVSTFESGKWGSATAEGADPNRSISAASRQDFYDFLNSSLYKDLKSMGYSSEQIIEIYDELTENMTPEEASELLQQAYEKFMDDKEAGESEFRDFLGLSPFDM